MLPAFFRNGRCDRVEYQFVRRDGSAIDVLLSATLERDEHGATSRSLAVLEDVTATKALEAELGRTHAHLDAVVDNMPALVGYWDRDAVTRFVNRDFQAAVGLPTDRLIGRPPAARSSPRSTPWATHAGAAHRGACSAAGARSSSGRCSPRRACASCASRWCRPSRSTGQADGFYGTWFDITGMKSLELRQRNSEQRYRLLFDHLASGHALHTIEVDEAGTPVNYRFLAMNAAFSAMLGIDAATAVGSRVTDVFPGHRRTTPPTGSAASAAWRSPASRRASSSCARPGRWWDIVAYRPVQGQFAVIAQDISERKRLEAEVAELRKQLGRADEA